MPPATPMNKLYRVDENGCWIWLLAKHLGYGHLSRKEFTGNAHRWMWLQLRGPIPEGLHVDHLCRVRACVNPDHMELVTVRENVLRGDGPTAINRRKTHCKWGHEFTPKNTYWYPRDGGLGRGCRQCRNASARAIYWNNPEAAKARRKKSREAERVLAA